jgi:hypothetical protein
MHNYVGLFGASGAFALEAGGRQKRLHCQGVMKVRMMPNEEGVKTMVNHIKAYIPIVRGSAGTVVCKPLEVGQSWTYMLGYIQKDHGQVSLVCASTYSP